MAGHLRIAYHQPLATIHHKPHINNYIQKTYGTINKGIETKEEMGMNRILLEQMFKKMRILLENGAPIGDLKIGALYALGNQLEAIFYFIGHELGGSLDQSAKSKLGDILNEIVEKYHLGGFKLEEEGKDHVTFVLDECRSCKDIDVPKNMLTQGFCSFEAGLFAGVVEKSTGKHCFAQELECHLNSKTGAGCKFMIVIPEN